MQSAQQTTGKKDRLWQCGEPLSYAPPKPQGDPWQTVKVALSEDDKKRCEVWKEEVNNLMIFAGLFSAVVTAFVIESYQDLEPDPAKDTVYLLAYLVSRIDGGNSNTTMPTVGTIDSSAFDADSSSIRVNVCWFLSLLLSLTSVLIGITVLQWIRVYQQMSDIDATSKQAVGIYQMRAESFEKWGVTGFVNSIPLLLQAALVLFFAGMIEFSRDLSQELFTLVWAVTGVTLLFYTLTTVLPTLQIFSFSLVHIDRNYRPPAPCPYKSPQSSAFRLLAFLTPIAHCINALYIMAARFYKALPISHIRKYEEYPDTSNILKRLWESSEWADFDEHLLELRSSQVAYSYLRAVNPEKTSDVTHAVAPVYDAMNIVPDLWVYTRCLANDLGTATYHCLVDLAAHNSNNTLLQLSRCPVEQRDTSPMSSMTKRGQDQFLYYLLAGPGNIVESGTESDRLDEELDMRITISLFGGRPVHKTMSDKLNFNGHCERAMEGDPFGEHEVLAGQHRLLLQTFINNSTTYDESTVKDTYHLDSSAQFVLACASRYLSPYRRPEAVEEGLKIFENLRSALEQEMSANQDPPAAPRIVYAFACAVVIIHFFEQDMVRGYTEQPRPQEVMDWYGSMKRTLLKYENCLSVDITGAGSVYRPLLKKITLPSKRWLDTEGNMFDSLITQGNPSFPPADTEETGSRSRPTRHDDDVEMEIRIG